MEEYSTDQAVEALRLAADMIWGENPNDSILERAQRIYEVRPTLLQPLTTAIYRGNRTDPAQYLEAFKELATVFPEGSQEQRSFALVEVGLLTSQGRVDEARPLIGEAFGSLGLPPEVYLFSVVMPGLADTTVLGVPIAETIPQGWSDQDADLWSAFVQLASGNLDAADATLARMEARTTPDATPLTEAYRQVLRGWRTLAGGDAREAAEDLRLGVEALEDPGLRQNPSIVENMRFRYYEALTLVDETRQEGIAGLQSFVPIDLHVEVAKRLVLAEALEAAGNDGDAAVEYQSFLNIMKSADPPFATSLERAHQGLARTGDG